MAWLQENPDASANRVGFVAEAIGRLGQLDAGDAVVALIPKLEDPQDQCQVGVALLRLGRKEGFPLLLLVAARPDSTRSPHRRFEALRTLAKASGVATEAASLDTATAPTATAEINAKIAAAVKVYSEWWRKNGSALVYDAAADAWRSK